MDRTIVDSFIAFKEVMGEYFLDGSKLLVVPVIELKICYELSLCTIDHFLLESQCLYII